MRSSACRDRMCGVCRGYTDGYETYRCECACHGAMGLAGAYGTTVGALPGGAEGQ